MKNKPLAEESLKTRKIRKKLATYFAALEQHITSEALQRKSYEIHRWIHRYSADRIPLKSKASFPFDENQNTAKLSRKIRQLAQHLAPTSSEDTKLPPSSS